MRLGTLRCVFGTSRAVIAAMAIGVPLAGAVPVASAAQSAEAPVFIFGDFRYAGGSAQVSTLHAAIEDVVSEMNFVIRPIARSRLKRANQPGDVLRIEVRDQTIHVVRPGRAIVAAPADGSFVHWKSDGGEEFRVRHRLVSERKLVQEFFGDGSRAVNTYRITGDGSRIVAETMIEADQLPKPLRYSLTYRRR